MVINMNIAVLLAGGADPNFKMDIPKQFVNVYNRPLIVYTMQVFQNHPEIDEIMVSCISGWENMVMAYAKQFKISKLKYVINGGKSGQETSRLSVEKLLETCSREDIIILHDAIRPLVTDEIISDSICCCRKNGMGIAAVGSMDNVMTTNDGITGNTTIQRHAFRRIQTPQTYQLGQLYDAHHEALKRGIEGENDTNNMMSKLGKKVNFSKGSDLNLKVNTVEDIEMFKALYNMYNDMDY